MGPNSPSTSRPSHPIDHDNESIVRADKEYLWHPFTPMRDWICESHEPLVIVRGEGASLFDAEGNEYLDGNSTIWTNIHGHCHPVIDAAIREQLDRIAHVSSLGFTNESASLLAQKLVEVAPGSSLNRVFLSDDGSTAVECAMKMAVQFHQIEDNPARCEFLAFDGAYHGDTAGASALGGIGAFHDRFSHLAMKVHRVGGIDDLSNLATTERIAGAVIEPLIQGAAGMKTWPPGMLMELRRWCDSQGILLILDEVMTGFGRTGTLFACEQEEVVPDFLALAKGLTGGYLPLAATMTTDRIFRAFLNAEDGSGPDNTFYYGHSYTGNPLGCAAALASLEVFETENTLARLRPKIALMAKGLSALRHLPQVAATRQCGFIAAIDLCQRNGVPFPREARTGATVCIAARKHGLLTRPIGDTIVLMPPLCTTADQLAKAFAAIEAALESLP